MKHFKRILFLLPGIIIAFLSLSTNNYTFAAQGWDDIDVDYYIIPEIKEDSYEKIKTATERIWQTGQNVMEQYKIEAKSLTAAECFNSWIMTRDCIMDYFVFVIKFLGQLWLAIWVGFIMYAGYKYMINIFGWNTIDKKMVTNAIIGVLIIIFSYAIMKFFLAIVWLA